MFTRVVQCLLIGLLLSSAVTMAAPSASAVVRVIARTAPIVRSLMVQKVPQDAHGLAVMAAELGLLGFKEDADALRAYADRRVMHLAMGQTQAVPSPTVQAVISTEHQSKVPLDEAKQLFAGEMFPVDFTRTKVSDEEVQEAHSRHWILEVEGVWRPEIKLNERTGTQNLTRIPPFPYVAAVLSNNTQVRGEIHIQLNLAPGVQAGCDAQNVPANSSIWTDCQITYPDEAVEHISELMVALKAGGVHGVTSQMLFKFGHDESRLILGTQYAKRDAGLYARVDAEHLLQAASCEDLANCEQQRSAKFADSQLRSLGVLALIMGITVILRLRAVAHHYVKGWPTGLWLAYLVITGLVGILSVLDPPTGHGYEGMLSTLAQYYSGMPWTAVAFDVHPASGLAPIGYHPPESPPQFIFTIVNFVYLSFMTFYRSQETSPQAGE
jgi:hypothetical protein